jgi:hypothetical protein
MTPVTIEVNAVPPQIREYALPSEPITKAPTADTISPRSGKYKFDAVLAA